MIAAAGLAAKALALTALALTYLAAAAEAKAKAVPQCGVYTTGKPHIRPRPLVPVTVSAGTNMQI